MFHLSGCPLCAGCRFCNHNQQFTLRSHPSSPYTHCDNPRKSPMCDITAYHSASLNLKFPCNILSPAPSFIQSSAPCLPRATPSNPVNVDSLNLKSFPSGYTGIDIRGVVHFHLGHSEFMKGNSKIQRRSMAVCEMETQKTNRREGKGAMNMGKYRIEVWNDDEKWSV
ncbi:hypothetical protein BJ165DRAFT_751669 [Panaeolus papilionaceus]|nr:hypothetical protein BJ165DRAFT_751669 [Panaeolus papilionaceus]